MGDLLAADTEAQKLMNRFANRADALWAVSEIAETNSRLGRHQQARDLFRFNLSNYPASDDTIWSLRSFINESIALNDNAGADAGIKKLLSEYAASKNLPMAVLHAGRTLCNSGRAAGIRPVPVRYRQVPQSRTGPYGEGLPGPRLPTDRARTARPNPCFRRY